MNDAHNIVKKLKFLSLTEFQNVKNQRLLFISLVVVMNKNYYYSTSIIIHIIGTLEYHL